MGNRIKFKVEELFESELGISDIENGERKTLKLGKKVSKDIFRTGSIYEGLVSGEWLNFVFENKVEQRKEEVQVTSTPKIENSSKILWNDRRELLILYQNQSDIALRMFNSVPTFEEFVKVRDKLVKDILERCK